MLDGLQQLRGFSLTHDLVKLCRFHSCNDQLLERFARFDPLMLAAVPDEQHAVAGFEFCEEVTDLFRTGKTGFIHHVKMTVVVPLAGPDEETLQGVGRDTGVTELVRGAGCRGKAFDDITAFFGCFANRF